MVGIYHLYKRKQRKGRFTSCRGEKKRKGKEKKSKQEKNSII
jgi:hypothetical protein